MRSVRRCRFGRREKCQFGGDVPEFNQGREQDCFRAKKFPCLTGLPVTAAAYAHFIKENALDAKIRETLAELDTHNMKQLEEKGDKVRQLILGASFPADLEKEIKAAFAELGKQLKLLPQRFRRSRQIQRHGRRFAGRQFCRTAGKLLKHTRRRQAD